MISLSRISGRDKLQLIRNIYNDEKEDPQIRLAAAAAQLHLKESRGLSYIKEQSKNSLEDKVAAALCLLYLPSAEGYDILEGFIKEENPQVNAALLVALWTLEDKSKDDHLPLLLRHLGPYMKIVWFKFFGNFDTPGSIAALKEIIGNPVDSLWVRSQAVSELCRMAAENEDILADLPALFDKGDDFVRSRILISIKKHKLYDKFTGELRDEFITSLKDDRKELEERKAKKSCRKKKARTSTPASKPGWSGPSIGF